MTTPQQMDERMATAVPAGASAVRTGPLVVAAAVAVAFALRWVGLGAHPLGPGEASAAVAGWWTAAGGGADLSRLSPRPDSALLLGLDAVVFWLAGGATDLLARLTPALAGAGLALVALLRRPEPWRAVAPLALLLALDPWLVAASRWAEGAILAAAGAIACHLALSRLWRAGAGTVFGEAARRHWTIWALGAGLVAVSGEVAWDLLPPLVAIAILAGGSGSGATVWGRPRAGVLVAVAVAAALVASTSGLVQWRGPGLVSWSLESWLASWSRSDHAAAATLVAWSPLTWAYQSVLVALALVGLLGRRPRSTEVDEVGAAPGREERAMVLLWLLWGVAVQLRSDSAAWLALQLPLLVAAGLGIERLSARRLAGGPRRLPVAAALGGVVLATSVAVAAAAAAPQQPRTLPAVRRLAADLAVLVARPARERPAVEIETQSGAVDAVLAWYLRGLPVDWATVASNGEDAAERIVLRSRRVPVGELPVVEAQPLYTIGLEGERMHVVELP
ncbi:MAG TPA: hypothetical protein VMS76_08065 [Planctomycetota bacterium]|nr:hypothetical protein [Planctomycetota bacterium]